MAMVCLQHVLVDVQLGGTGVLAHGTHQERLRMCEQVLLELVFAVESLAAQRAVERSLVHHPVLDQVGSGREPLIAQRTRVRSVAEVQVLVLHQYVLVAETPVTNVALVWFLADVRQPDVPDQAVLVSELFIAERALESPVLGGRCLGQQRQFGGGYLRSRWRRRDRLRSLVADGERGRRSAGCRRRRVGELQGWRMVVGSGSCRRGRSGAVRLR